MKDAVKCYRDVQESCGRAQRTIGNSLLTINRFLSYVGDKRIDEVTKEDVRKWMRECDVNDISMRTYLSTLNNFFTILIEEETFGITKNPVSMTMRRYPNKRTEIKKPNRTVAQVANFLKSVRDIRDRTMFITLAKCGLRVGELVCLTVADYDDIEKTLSITKHAGANRNHASDITPGRKNKATTLLPVDAELAYVLSIYIKASGNTGDTTIFTTRDGRRMGTQNVCDRFHTWSLKSGFELEDDDDGAISPRWFRNHMSYELQNERCMPMVVDYLRGDVAGDMKDYYARQILPFEKIRSEYLRAVPQYGL